MKLSNYIIDFIRKEWTDTIFSFSGWMITHLEDSVFLNKKIQLVSVKHEQAWAFAAEWYARSSWKTWVAMWTSWPWATNMITWIASAYFDSVPVLYITGQVNTNEITHKTGIRQTWFQEADIVSMVSKITKFAYQISKPEEIRYILEKSFFLANFQRKWPIVLDIPMNIQRQEIIPKELPSFFDSKEYMTIKKKEELRIKRLNKDTNNLRRVLAQSKKPVILLWWWCKSANVKKDIASFAKKFNIPVVVSLMWLDSIDHTIKNYIWMIGSYGNRQANIAIMNCDLLLVLWSRLDIRQTWAIKKTFCPKAKIVHIDIDDNELGYNIEHTHVKIHQDLRDIVMKLKTIPLDKKSKRLDQLIKIKRIITTNETEKKEWKFYNINYFFEKISNLSPKNTIYSNDVGQTQMWASQSLELSQDQQLLNCGWMWAMWFSLPSAMWAYFGNPKYKIIAINGDGWFQLNIQELETIAHHKIPMIIIVVNNHSLWMVREFQEAYFWWRNIWTVIGYSCPDISKIAWAYGLTYYKIWGTTDIKKVFTNAMKEKTPTIVEVLASNTSKLVPKVMFGNTIDNQSPELDEKIKSQIQRILNQ